MQKVLDQSYYFSDRGNLTLYFDRVQGQPGPIDAIYATDVSVKTRTVSFIHRHHTLEWFTTKYIWTSASELNLELDNVCLNLNSDSINLYLCFLEQHLILWISVISSVICRLQSLFNSFFKELNKNE